MSTKSINRVGCLLIINKRYNASFTYICNYTQYIFDSIEFNICSFADSI